MTNETTLFQINELNDNGRAIYSLGIFRASSKIQAREIASKYYNNKEIITTGFYGASEINEKLIEIQKQNLLDQLAKLEVLNK
jgi:hypothetical protein